MRATVVVMSLIAGLAGVLPGEAQPRHSRHVVASSSGTSWDVTPTVGTMPGEAELRVEVTGDVPVRDLRVEFREGFGSAAEILAAVAPASMPDGARVRAIFDFVRARYYQWAAPSDWTGLGYSPTRFLQFFGYGLCNDAAAVFGTLAFRAGYPVRIWNPGTPPQHVVAEVFYDGAWHMYDANWPAVFMRRDGSNVASVEDLIADPSLVEDAGPPYEILVDIYTGTPPDAYVIMEAAHLPPDAPIHWSLWPTDILEFSTTPFGRHVDDNTWPTAAPLYGSGQLRVSVDAADERTHGRVVATRNVERRLEPEGWVWAPVDAASPADLFVRVDVPYPIVDVDATVAVVRKVPGDRISIGAVRDAEDLTLADSDWPSGLFRKSPAFLRGANLATIDDDGMFPLLHAASSAAPAELVFRVLGRAEAPRLAATVFRHQVSDRIAVDVSNDDISWMRLWEPAPASTGYHRVDVELPAGWDVYHVRVVLDSATAGGWGAGLSSLHISGVAVPDPLPIVDTTTSDWPGAQLGVITASLAAELTPRRGHLLHSYLVHVRLQSDVLGGAALASLQLTSTFQTSRDSPARIVGGSNAYAITYTSDVDATIDVVHSWTEHPLSTPVPPAPTDLAPPAAVFVEPETVVALSWRAVADAPRYRVRLCLDDACAHVLAPDLEATVIDVGHVPAPVHRVTWTVPGAARLVRGRTYYWRVQGFSADGVGGPWSAVAPLTRQAPFGLAVAGPAVRTVELPWTTISGGAVSPDVQTVRWATNRGANGVATGTTNWTFAFHPAAGENIVTIDAVSALGYTQRTLVRVSTTPRHYLLAEGATGEFFDTTVSVANPHALAAPFRLRLLADTGTLVDEEHLLPPWTTTRFELDELVGHRQLAVATEVVSLRGLPLVVERTGTWGDDASGAHGSTAISTLSRDWYFAEGSQGFFDTYWLVVNPHPEVVRVTALFMLDGGGVITETHEVAGGSRLNVFAGHVPGLAGRSFAAVFRATADVAVDRAMYFPAGGPWLGGHASPGVVAPAREWSFAEGATGTFFDTFLLLGNPGDRQATATVRFLLATGNAVVKTVVVPAQSRVTVWVDDLPELTAAEFSVLVSADEPVVAERAMYWPYHTGVWDDAHAVLGGRLPASRWGVAEVRTGGTSAHDTYLLIANPSDRDVDVRVSFFGDGEPHVQRTYRVRAASRFTVSTAIMVPQLAGRRVGAVAEAVDGTPIFVESAMYWNGAGRAWAAGTGRRATPLETVP